MATDMRRASVAAFLRKWVFKSRVDAGLAASIQKIQDHHRLGSTPDPWDHSLITDLVGSLPLTPTLSPSGARGTG